MATSLYIHIPFCTAKCNYCSFNSYVGLEGLKGQYIDSLCVELCQNTPRRQMTPLRTIFIGGGTPSILPGSLLEKLLTATFSIFPVHEDAEITIEANPGTVDRTKLDHLQKLGVNRLSLGVQSFHDQELEKIGRIHSAEEAVQAVHMASDAGFKNISIDLMYGLPGQDASSWQTSLETALSLKLNHLSLYQLTVEQKTPLEKMVSDGRIELPGDDELAAMDKMTTKLMSKTKLYQYEISNYARPGFQCRHNITYWENRDYLGVGAGAVSCQDRSRKQNIGDPEKYCNLMNNEKSTVAEEEQLDSEASFRETVIMGLRMNRGVAINELQKRYRIQLEDHYGHILKQLVQDKLLKKSASHLSLTDRGRQFANRVMAELV